VYSLNAEAASAQRAVPPFRAYAAQGMNRLAALEQQVKDRLALPDKVAEVREAISQLAPNNPFRAQLQNGLHFAEANSAPHNIAQTLNTLNMIKDDAAAAQEYADRLNEVSNVFNQLNANDPFRAKMEQAWHMEVAAAQQPTPSVRAFVAQAKNRLAAMEKDAVDAKAFAARLNAVFAVINKLAGTNAFLHAQLMNYWNAEVGFAHAALPPFQAHFAQATARLANLEQQALAALPAKERKAIEELRALQARADKVWNEIEAVSDDDAREELLAQYRKLEKTLGSSQDIAPKALAEAAKLLADLEKKVKEAEPPAEAADEEEQEGQQKDEGQEKDEGEPEEGKKAESKKEEPETPLKAATAAWKEATGKVKAQLRELGSFLKQTGDPGLIAIAQDGLKSVGNGNYGPMKAALRALDTMEGRALKRAKRTARKLVKAFGKDVRKSKQVKACEKNPFGVSVSIRNTLKPAYKKLLEALKD
jgi:hypothetical protein